MRVSTLTKLFAGLGAALTMAACGDSTSTPKTVLGSNYTYWKITDNAEKAYPKLKPMEARKRYVQDKFKEMAATKTPEEQRAEAASFYAGYMMLNAVAIPQYCQGVNVDISEYAKSFKARNQRSEDSLDAVLLSQGVTRDELWQKTERYAMSAAKNELLAAAGLNGGSYTSCKAVQKNPNKFLVNANFGKHFPDISRALNP